MTKKFITGLKFWLFETLKLQLFLNIISFVILIQWGLPISIMSPIGNILFAPMLTIFLILSSLVFFTELLSISNWLLTISLEVFTNFWIKLLNLSCESWKISYAKPHLAISVIGIILSIIVYKHNGIKNNFNKLIYLILIFILMILSTKINIFSNNSNFLTYQNEKIEIILDRNKVIITDNGLLEKASWYWIQYNLITYLIQKYGHTNIERLEIKNMNKKIYTNLKILSKKCNIKLIVRIDNNYSEIINLSKKFIF